MLIQYNGIDLLPGKTETFHMRAIRDPSGLDICHQEVTLGAICIMNPAMLAAAKPPGATGYDGIGTGALGDRPGLSLLQLRQTLFTDRKPLMVDLGLDRIFRAPPLRNNGTAAPCDPIGGPFVEDVRIIDVLGDKSVVLVFRVRFAFTDDRPKNNSKFISSHRWSMSSETKENGLTSRSIEGRAIFRLDMLEGNTPARLVADQLRVALAHPCPDGMIRKSVRVQVLPDGRECTYHVLDQQVERNLGPNTPIYKIEGNVTAGADMPIKDVKQGMEAMAGAVKDVAGKIITWDFVGAFSSALSGIWKNAIGSPKMNGIVRVFGRTGADRATLVQIGTEVLLARFGKNILGNNLYPVSFYVTEDIGNENTPFIEIRIEVLPVTLPGLKAMFKPANAAKLLDLKADITETAEGPVTFPLKTDMAWGNPPFPASGEMRGVWMGKLIGQVLSSATGLWPAPPDGPDPKNLQEFPPPA